MRLCFFLSPFLLGLTTAKYSLFESLPSVPEGWRKLDKRVSAGQQLSLRIHLRPDTDASEFEKELYDISSPESPRYGQHHSQESLKAFTKPAASAVDAVVRWLRSASRLVVPELSGDVIKIRLPVQVVEELLKTKYAQYVHDEDGRTAFRTTEYSLPEEIKPFVSMIQPTTMFGLRPLRARHGPIKPFEVIEVIGGATGGGGGESRTKSGNIPAACNETIDYNCLAQLYGFEGYTSSGRASVGISGFLEQWAQQSDFARWVRQFRPSIPANTSFLVQSINGGINPQNVTDPNQIAEANLDVQYALGIAYPAKTTYYTTAGRPPYIPDLDVVENDSEPYLEYLEYLLSLKDRDLPSVITTSYGESEQTVPLSYRHTVCDLFGLLGARGVSVIFSSGDSGPGWSCRSNDNKNTTKFLPTFPAGCPYVTAVGGTVGITPERAVYFSSGGFSETWRRPAYQSSAVETFFRNHESSWKPWAKYFSRSGRGIPDVAAQGSDYQVVLGGKVYLIGGTSASAPAFAGIVALVNDYRAGNGEGKLGFLNPLLYSKGAKGAFTDVVDGRSTGCDGLRWGEPIKGNPAIVPGAGWDAVEGWDPVTGLGTPKFAELKNLGIRRYGR